MGSSRFRKAALVLLSGGMLLQTTGGCNTDTLLALATQIGLSFALEAIFSGLLT